MGAIKTKLGKTFGDRVRYRRGELGLTQSALAKTVGVSITTIQSYETGAMPKGSVLVSLSDALGCSIDWLLKGRDVSADEARQETKQISLDIDLLTEIIETLEAELARKGLAFEPARKARFVAMVYERHAGKTTPAGDTRKVLDLLESE